MPAGRGDRLNQRQRRRDRYRGCRVCGIRGESCAGCGVGAQIVAQHGAAGLVLIVDGSFVPHEKGARRSSGWGGAGLVLTRGGIHGKVLADRACGFLAQSSTDAERHAIIRGARWAPGVEIYTDCRELPIALAEIPTLRVQYLPPGRRSAVHARAHLLSVEGRCRDAPPEGQTDAEMTRLRSGLTKRERKQAAVDLLLEKARAESTFDGDFVKVAESLGWTSGKRWRDNPLIRIAAEAWTRDNGAPHDR